MQAVRVGKVWYVADEVINVREGELLRVCMDCGVVLGIKSGCGNTGVSHGLCPKCNENRMEEIERAKQ